MTVHPRGPDEPASSADPLAVAASLARRIAEWPGQDPVVTARATSLAERIVAQRYHIAVLGEFKRGKSTLVNALVGGAVLPTGVTPLTAVATEVHFGSQAGAAVVFSGGRRVGVGYGELAAYVTETGNPSNRRGVDHVEVGIELTGSATWAVPGAVLVDTPGIASVFAHQSAVARDALAVADGAIVVLSVDSPVSQEEQALLAEVAERQCRVFVVVNKCDHLDPDELTEVRRFVAAQVRSALGDGVEPYFLAARPALEGPDGPGGEFGVFREALRRFLHRDLLGARTTAALTELERLAHATAAASALELAVADLGVERLDAQARRFETAVEEGRQRFAEDRLLLGHEVAALADELASFFEEEAAHAAGPAWAAVAGRLDGVPLRRLDRTIAALLPAQIEEAIEPLRRAGHDKAESGWADVARRFEWRLRARVEDLRAHAGELFEVRLPAPAATPVRDHDEQFTYLVLTVESPGTAAARSLAHALPIGAVRRKVLLRAEEEVRRELVKHANRARYDLVERLRTAERRFVAELGAELEETERSIGTAVERGRALLVEGRFDRDARRRADDDVSSLVRDVADLAMSAPSGGPVPP